MDGANATTMGLVSLHVQPYLAHDNDLDVGWITRLPVRDFPVWPTEGQTVTWRAMVKNWRTNTLADVPYAWYLDGALVASGAVALAPLTHTPVDYSWAWHKAPRRTLTFEIDTGNTLPEYSELNNRLTVFTDAISAGFWVEQTQYNASRRTFDNAAFTIIPEPLCAGMLAGMLLLRGLRLKR